jgi:hypothetical protein
LSEVTPDGCAASKAAIWLSFVRWWSKVESPYVLDSDSSFLKPIWLLLLKDRSGALWRVTTSTNSLARRVESIGRVYQIART